MEKSPVSRQSYIEMMLRSYSRYYDVHLTEGSQYNIFRTRQGHCDEQSSEKSQYSELPTGGRYAGQSAEKDQYSELPAGSRCNGQSVEDGQCVQGEEASNIPAPLPPMEGLPIVARCDFHVQNDTSVLLRRNVLYSTQNHEYRYLFEIPHLSLEQYKAFEQFVYDDGMKRIKPGNGHMSTNLTLAIITGSADLEAVKAAKHCSLHKEFRMGLDGWMDFHTNLITLDEQKIFTNMGGHNDRKHLKQIFKMLNKRQN